jgi:hypothetical protein
MGISVVIYVSSFIKTGSGLQKLIGMIHIQTHKRRREGDFMSIL